MKNRSLGTMLMVMLAIMVLIGSIGCSSASQQAAAASTPSDYVAKTITVGNHSWVPINRFAEPDEYDMTAESAISVLETIDAFERSHPELDVIDWKQEIKHTGHSSRFKVFGIWVDHKAKPGFEEEIKTQ